MQQQLDEMDNGTYIEFCSLCLAWPYYSKANITEGYVIIDNVVLDQHMGMHYFCIMIFKTVSLRRSSKYKNVINELSHYIPL